MPIKELSEITDYKAYQKILKRDLEQAKFKAQPFLYVESFKFTGGKVGPALLVGKVEPSLGLKFKANGTATTLARGRCRFVKDTATFVVDDLAQYRYYRQQGYFAGYPPDATELADVLAAEAPHPPGLRIYVPLGIALEDVAVAAEINRRAADAGLGRELPL